MTGSAALVVVVAVFSVMPVSMPPQIELDRIVSRVGGRIVTSSDIRQAQRLKLVDDVTSEPATLRALETRLLILQELNRAAPVPSPTAPDLDTRRADWIASVGGSDQVSGLLQQGAMSEGDLDRWLRDDLRIAAYLRRQFGMLADAERTRARGDWLGRLRERADLAP